MRVFLKFNKYLLFTKIGQIIKEGKIELAHCLISRGFQLSGGEDMKTTVDIKPH